MSEPLGLAGIGEQLRSRRKALQLSAVAVSEAAGVSRPTLHRVERGEPSVAAGAYAAVASALGWELQAHAPSRPQDAVHREGWIPVRIPLDDYPQLRQLAWQVHGTEDITPAQAHSIYERNWKHADLQAMEPRERELVESLRAVFSRAAPHV